MEPQTRVPYRRRERGSFRHSSLNAEQYISPWFLADNAQRTHNFYDPPCSAFQSVHAPTSCFWTGHGVGRHDGRDSRAHPYHAQKSTYASTKRNIQFESVGVWFVMLILNRRLMWGIDVQEIE